jgi:hypothetical protein
VLAQAPASRPTSAPAPTTQPAAPPRPALAGPQQRFIRRAAGFINNASQREDQRRLVIDAQDGGMARMSDLIRFSVVDGRLESEWVGKSTNRQPKRMRIEGSDATWLVNHIATTTGAFYSVSRFLFDGPEDDFWMVQFSTQEGLGNTTLIAQGGETCDLLSLAFTQAPTGLTLMLNERGVNRRRMITVTDLDELRRKHPDEACRYFLPLLRSITGQPILRPGAGDVYRVFTDIPADPAVTHRIDELLPALGSADPAERDRATAALSALGRPGALAALRYDTDLLLPEQRTRLQNLVTKQTVLGFEDPTKEAGDVNFLVECLEDEDLAVRTHAKALLEQVLGRKIEFDPAAPPDKRATVAAAIRVDLAHTAADRRDLDKPLQLP